MTEVSHDLMAYATKVIDAIGGVKGKVNYGEFHLGPIPILFDGEPSDWEIAEVDDAYWVLRSVSND